MNSGTIFEPYDRNYDPDGRYQGKANYNIILRDIISQPDEAFDEDLFPYHCYCYDSVHNKLSHVGSLSHDDNTFTIHSAPISSDGYLKHFVSCVTALGPDMLVGNAERCTSSAFNDRIQYYNPLDIDFSAYRVGFSFLVKNTDTDNQEWVYSIDELKALDSTKNVVVQTAGRLFFKIESTGDWGGFVNNDNSSSIIYNCNDRVLYAKSSARFTGSSGIDVVPHWTMGCLKNGTVVAANAEMNDADTGYLIAGVVNTADGEIELPISEKYNFTEDGLVIEVIEDWDNRDRITITTCLSIEQTLKEVAYLGLIVCHYSSATVSVYAGYIDSDGLATGELIPYEEWEKTDSLNVKNQFMTDFPDLHIKPKPSPDPDDKDDYPDLSLDTIGATGLATGVSWFVMSEADMGTLSKLGVYHANPAIIETPWETINKANAVSKAAEDAVISILHFPYDVYRMHSAEGRHGTIRVYIPGIFNSDSEWFGATECWTGAQGGYITNLNRIINAGSAVVPTRADRATFLDFEPYTSLQMYVPFAGWVSLPCSQCMGATVALQYVIDPPTGSGRAFISANGCIIRDIPFTIGNITPTSVHQTGPLMGPLMNTAFGVAGTIAGAAVAAETGGLSATMGASMAVGAVSNLSNTLMDSCVPKTQTVGTNGTAITSFPTPKTPVILINRPRIKIPNNMGHRYGYACDKEAVLSDLSGMTVCSNVDTSGINATAGEKARLKAILESGFYA